ncbi:MAG TPA: hypothetical protein VHA82_22910 [Ramlibacter sp.]|uniref:hypothetical protein n=1 Tax=Ramlibacter sp. TaxID=1917967 RepID=UPI002CFF4129|nr:hypothetical protein [Ramlibacter sp.]HVZ46675.1 hypothetical protein [Ramlibacter sp.]
MTNRRLSIASSATALALAGFVATGIHGASLPALAKADANPVSSGRVQPDAPAGDVRVRAQFTQELPVFGNNLTNPASQQMIAVTGTQSRTAQQVTDTVPPRDAAYYSQLRSRLNWVPVRLGNTELKTPDMLSRLMLVQSAARRAGLAQVGLSFADVYGIINAETSWIPRVGASKDGTPNLGIAQFEPATAKALGLSNPQDPVESVHVMALHLKDAALWSARKLQGLKLSPAMYTAKLREGLSVYYNLSSKGRSQWNGLNTAKLPIETRRHISNAAQGAREAQTLEAEVREMRAQGRMEALNSPASGFLKTGG